MKNLLILTLALFTISCCKEEEPLFDPTGTYKFMDELQIPDGWPTTFQITDFKYNDTDITGQWVSPGAMFRFIVNVEENNQLHDHIFFTKLDDYFQFRKEYLKNYERYAEFEIRFYIHKEPDILVFKYKGAQYNGPIKKLSLP